MADQQSLELPEGLEWVCGADANESDGVVAGCDEEGNALFVARGRSGDETGTACLISGAAEAVMGFFGLSIQVEDYDLLCCSTGSVKWVSASDGDLPDGAIAVGKDEKKRLIYIARVRIGPIVLPAKLIVKFHGAFAGWDVMEYLRRKYEVLCLCPEEEQIDVHEVVDCGEIDLPEGHEEEELVDERKEQVEVPEGLAWCYAHDGASFDNAVKSGADKEDRELHVVRGSEAWELAPGVLRIGEACASIPYYKIGSKHDKYEVLVNEGDVPLKWVKASCGEVPDNAIQGGVNRKGEIMYVARVNICGVWTPGKLNVTTKRAYGAQDGRETTRKKYEVLCLAEEGEEPEYHPAIEDEEEEEEEEDERYEQVPAVDCIEWVSCKDGEIPENSVVIDGGDDQQQCVVRVSEEEELVTGGVCHGESAIVPYYGIAEDCETYQCLTNTSIDDCPLFWVPSSCDSIPEVALQCGVTNGGGRIFCARAKVEGSALYCAGKVIEGLGEAFFAYCDNECASSEFEILCYGPDAEGLDDAIPCSLKN